MEMGFSEKQLMAMDKDTVIQLHFSLKGEMKKQSEELHALNEKMQLLMEQVILSNKARFGRSTEKAEITGQLHFEFVDGDTVPILNEAEAESHLEDPEPEDLLDPSLKEIRKKQKGKRAADMEGLLKGSPVTPSLASCILDEKYVSAVPLYRQELVFTDPLLKYGFTLINHICL